MCLNNLQKPYYYLGARCPVQYSAVEAMKEVEKINLSILQLCSVQATITKWK